jgi:hypothetical protein
MADSWELRSNIKGADGATGEQGLTGSVSSASWLDLSEQPALPTAPQAGVLRTFAGVIATRLMLGMRGPSGLHTLLQPALFQNHLWLVSPNQTTSVMAIGNAVVSVGTLSHPAPSAALGWMTNFLTAATAGATAGTGNRDLIWRRGNGTGVGGFFFVARLALPDASYNESGAGTGSRLFVGLTNQTLAASVAADNPAGHFCGFLRRSVNGGAIDANWQFALKDNTTLALHNTALPFAPGVPVDFCIFCPPHGTTIHWAVADLLSGQSDEGSADANLPGATTLMRAGFQLATVNNVARNIRMQRLYGESDR